MFTSKVLLWSLLGNLIEIIITSVIGKLYDLQLHISWVGTHSCYLYLSISESPLTKKYWPLLQNSKFNATVLGAGHSVHSLHSVSPRNKTWSWQMYTLCPLTLMDLGDHLWAILRQGVVGASSSEREFFGASALCNCFYLCKLLWEHPSWCETLQSFAGGDLWVSRWPFLVSCWAGWRNFTYKFLHIMLSCWLHNQWVT